MHFFFHSEREKTGTDLRGAMVLYNIHCKRKKNEQTIKTNAIGQRI